MTVLKSLANEGVHLTLKAMSVLYYCTLLGQMRWTLKKLEAFYTVDCVCGNVAVVTATAVRVPVVAVSRDVTHVLY